MIWNGWINVENWSLEKKELFLSENSAFVTIFQSEDFFFLPHLRCRTSLKVLMNVPVKLEANQKSKVWWLYFFL